MVSSYMSVFIPSHFSFNLSPSLRLSDVLNDKKWQPYQKKRPCLCVHAWLQVCTFECAVGRTVGSGCHCVIVIFIPVALRHMRAHSELTDSEEEMKTERQNSHNRDILDVRYFKQQFSEEPRSPLGPRQAL